MIEIPEIYIKYAQRRKRNKSRKRYIAVYLSDEEHERIMKISEELGISASSLFGILRQAVEENDSEIIKKLHEAIG